MGKNLLSENFVGKEDYEIKRNENFEMRNILYTNIYEQYHDFARLHRTSEEKAFECTSDECEESVLKKNEPSLPIFWASAQRQYRSPQQRQRISLSRFLAL